MGLFKEMKLELVALAIFSFAFIFFQPFWYDFPQNDDATYSVITFNYAIGNFGFSSPALAAWSYLHFIYGASFLRLFGTENYWVLRVSVMVAMFFYSIAVFVVSRKLGLDRTESFLVAALVTTNPVVYNMAHTFMTDIPFSLLFLLSAYFYVSDKIFLGSIFAFGAVLIRQFGIALPVGAVLYLAAKNRASIKNMASAALLPTASFLAAYWWFYIVNNGIFINNFELGTYVLLRLSRIVLNLSFYLFPLVLLFAFDPGKLVRNLFAGRRPLVALFAILFLVPFVIHDYRKTGVIFPFMRFDFGERGLGAISLVPGLSAIAGEKSPIFSDWQLALFLLSSVLLFSYAVAAAVPQFFRKETPLLSVLLPYVLALVFTKFFSDRYVIPLLPFLFMLVVKKTRGLKFRYAAFLVTILLFGTISWYYNWEYMNINDARWKAAGFLTGQGVPRWEIDAGIDFCRDNDARGLNPKICEKSVTPWCCSGRYVVAFSELDGYETMGAFPYKDPFGKELGRLYALRSN